MASSYANYGHQGGGDRPPHRGPLRNSVRPLHPKHGKGDRCDEARRLDLERRRKICEEEAKAGIVHSALHFDTAKFQLCPLCVGSGWLTGAWGGPHAIACWNCCGYGHVPRGAAWCPRLEKMMVIMGPPRPGR
uniref:Uncharacterized protein n=1 Tax=Strigamia maritima TaxID=126957 RepID=T1IU31_STRMM